MRMAIPDFLSPGELAEIRAAARALRYADGRASAGWAARLVKENRQARPEAATLALAERVERAILSHQLFNLAVRPKALAPLIFARYGAGESYGLHVDDAVMGGMRTDVSFTLFLADPADYEGGDLVIEDSGGQERIKMAAGGLYLYPSTTLHEVAPVTAGERMVCVGWARSFIRRAGRRELLFDLDTARRAVFEKDGKSQAFDLLSKCAANLLREWVED